MIITSNVNGERRIPFSEAVAGRMYKVVKHPVNECLGIIVTRVDERIVSIKPLGLFWRPIPRESTYLIEELPAGSHVTFTQEVL